MHVVEAGLALAERCGRSLLPPRPTTAWSCRVTRTLAPSSPATTGTSPSFVLIRHMNELTPDGQADLLIAAIGEAEPEIEAGAVCRRRGLDPGPEASIRAFGEAGLKAD